jgi:hypothetical protein
MRLWSIHPKYLDTKSLNAVWREALLAKKVLQNKTKGYKNHPQLLRFKKQQSPVDAINFYLKEIYEESKNRNFNFDQDKIGPIAHKNVIPVTDGQINYEFEHLLKKLKERDKIRYHLLKNNKDIELNPLFTIVSGKIESWEKV